MTTREQLITSGKVWQIYNDATPDEPLHECASRTACFKWLKAHNALNDYKRGNVRIGKLICE